MFSLFVSVLPFVLSIYTNNCTKVQLQKNPPINLTEYIRSSWYIQQQQLTSYQRLDDLYCVVATYNNESNVKVPFFNGPVLSVYNYANKYKVNGISTNNSSKLCARVKDVKNPEKLAVAPCFLPNLFGGPYYILAAGPYTYKYDWAIVIGGQPNVYVSNNTCTTSEDKINNSGLWLFSRKKILDNETILKMYNILKKNNVSTTKLHNVSQSGCKYVNAFIK